jgi:hypothetical protein
MKIEDGKVFVRQSWLKDMMLCPHRALLAQRAPEFAKTNDSAAVGIAVHAGIEQFLNGGSADAAAQAANAKMRELIDAGLRTTNLDPADLTHYVSGLFAAWVKDIRPHVPADGTCEYHFQVPTGRTVCGFEMWFEGTMDYVAPAGLWDWKTSSRKYSPAEKQAQDIQASLYWFAATQLGLVHPEVPFNFGVMIRTASPYGQVVGVRRTAAHANFVIAQAVSAVTYALAVAGHDKWLMNDQHHLCSERWCPWWSICKGAHISEPDNASEA